MPTRREFMAASVGTTVALMAGPLSGAHASISQLNALSEPTSLSGAYTHQRFENLVNTDLYLQNEDVTSAVRIVDVVNCSNDPQFEQFIVTLKANAGIEAGMFRMHHTSDKTLKNKLVSILPKDKHTNDGLYTITFNNFNYV